MSNWLVFVVLSLAVARITRFLVADTFPPMRRARDRISRSSDFFGELFSCEWCTAVWVAFASVGVLIGFRPTPLPWLQAIAASLLGSWLAVKAPH